MEELVTKKFGADKWKASLRCAGLPDNKAFMTTADVPDSEVLAIMKGIGQAASLSSDQVMEAFGDYWSTVYAPDIYKVYFDKAKGAKELLLNLDQIHVTMTKSMKGAAPPHFTYESPAPNVLIMHYESPRGLVALMPALIRGVAKYYKEKVTVTTTGNSLRAQFS
jgi:methyl-accepting chemotaxis protein